MTQFVVFDMTRKLAVREFDAPMPHESFYDTVTEIMIPAPAGWTIGGDLGDLVMVEDPQEYGGFHAEIDPALALAAARTLSREAIRTAARAVLEQLDIETRLEELALLQDGWLDGKGRALDRASLIRLAQAFDERFGTDLPLPHLYPTPEGGVQAEWTLGSWEISLEITLSSLAADYQAVHTATGETREQTLLLAAEDGLGWAALNEALAQLQEAKT